MKIAATVSSLALALALSMSGGAMAQTMFNGAELSAEDLPLVTAQCEKLITAQDTAGALEDSTATEIQNDTEVDGSAQALSKIDLETVTIEQCKEAGLGGSAM